jgi:hypothetical protein
MDDAQRMSAKEVQRAVDHDKLLPGRSRSC